MQKQSALSNVRDTIAALMQRAFRLQEGVTLSEGNFGIHGNSYIIKPAAIAERFNKHIGSRKCKILTSSAVESVLNGSSGLTNHDVSDFCQVMADMIEEIANTPDYLLSDGLSIDVSHRAIMKSSATGLRELGEKIKGQGAMPVNDAPDRSPTNPSPLEIAKRARAMREEAKPGRPR